MPLVTMSNFTTLKTYCDIKGVPKCKAYILWALLGPVIAAAKQAQADGVAPAPVSGDESAAALREKHVMAKNLAADCPGGA